MTFEKLIQAIADDRCSSKPSDGLAARGAGAWQSRWGAQVPPRLCLSAYLPACPQEIPFSGLFRDLKNSTVFEASGEHTAGAQYLRALRSLAPCMRELHAWPVAGLNHSCTFRYAGLAYVRGKFYTIFDNAMSIGIMDDRFQFRQGTVLHQLLVPFSMRPHLACGLDWAWW